MDDHKCTCDEDDLEPHPCPFSEEIHDYHDDACTCCDYCTHECAMDI